MCQFHFKMDIHLRLELYREMARASVELGNSLGSILRHGADFLSYLSDHDTKCPRNHFTASATPPLNWRVLPSKERPTAQTGLPAAR